MKPNILCLCQVLLGYSRLYLNGSDLVRRSRKLRYSTKCLFLFYELPCLTVPISKDVWPAFLLPSFSLPSALTLFLHRHSLPLTPSRLSHIAVHTPAHVWCIISLVCGEAGEPRLSPTLSPCQSQRVCEHQL